LTSFLACQPLGNGWKKISKGLITLWKSQSFPRNLLQGLWKSRNGERRGSGVLSFREKKKEPKKSHIRRSTFAVGGWRVVGSVTGYRPLRSRHPHGEQEEGSFSRSIPSGLPSAIQLPLLRGASTKCTNRLFLFYPREPLER